MWKFVTDKSTKLNGATGFVTEGPGMGGAAIEGGLGAIVLSLILGAFFGLILGLILSHLFRFLSMACNRNLGGYSWAVIGAVIGAAIFAWFTVNGEKH